jgi:lipoprotein NlpD
VKATLDGTVIFTDWTLETGYVIVIQHAGNLISVYKHNAVLLKHEGDFVKAGEPVAIAGNSGEITTGPHLHFELWYKQPGLSSYL